MLDLKSGATVDSLRGMRAVYESHFEGVRPIDKICPELQTDEGKSIASIDRRSFALLSEAFGPEMVCISEAAGGIRCYSTSTGRHLWYCSPNRDNHVLNLAYAKDRGQFVGVEYCYKRGGPKVLVRFDGRADTPLPIVKVGEPAETAFCSEGNLLVTTDGRLFDTVTGSMVRTLPVFSSGPHNVVAAR